MVEMYCTMDLLPEVLPPAAAVEPGKHSDNCEYLDDIYNRTAYGISGN